MNSIGMFLAVNSLSIVCAIAAAVLCWKEREGWGWFLVVAALAFSSKAFFPTVITA